MFKTWQIFVFSFIPLTLVFIGVIGGSLDGVDSNLEKFPTPTPAPSPTPAAVQPVEAPFAEYARLVYAEAPKRRLDLV